MKIENVKIYDLEESIIASGYSMRTKAEMRPVEEKDLKRCHNLSAACDHGNGAHGQFLTGIRVAFDLTFTNKLATELQRYKFCEFVSSQSTIHRMTQFNLDEQYIKYTDPRVIEIMKEKVDEYNLLVERKENIVQHDHMEQELEQLNKDIKNKYLELLYTNPAGFELTARFTTNYRCLKNIYIQRKNHLLEEWHEFTNWIETLPYFEELINTNTVFN